jgi:hypothetical protein
VAPRVYATADDYSVWTGDLTAAASPAQLRAASARLDNALRGVYYATDEDGLPLELDVEEAMRDAVCAIVAYWEETGDTSGSGAGAEFQSASIGTANYTRSAGALRGLPQTAADIIAAAGLRIVSPVIYG